MRMLAGSRASLPAAFTNTPNPAPSSSAPTGADRMLPAGRTGTNVIARCPPMNAYFCSIPRSFVLLMLTPLNYNAGKFTWFVFGVRPLLFSSILCSFFHRSLISLSGLLGWFAWLGWLRISPVLYVYIRAYVFQLVMMNRRPSRQISARPTVPQTFPVQNHLYDTCRVFVHCGPFFLPTLSPTDCRTVLLKELRAPLEEIPYVVRLPRLVVVDNDNDAQQ